MSSPKFMAIVDTREQLPLDLRWRDGQFLMTKRGTLKTADYSVEGLEDKIAIERKSLQDLIGCIGKGRERFERCLDRMRSFDVRAVVVEGSWSMIERRQYVGMVHPNAVVGSILGWVASGIPFLLVDSRERASEYVARLLVFGHKRYGGDVAKPGGPDAELPDDDVHCVSGL